MHTRVVMTIMVLTVVLLAAQTAPEQDEIAALWDTDLSTATESEIAALLERAERLEAVATNEHIRNGAALYVGHLNRWRGMPVEALEAYDRVMERFDDVLVPVRLEAASRRVRVITDLGDVEAAFAACTEHLNEIDAALNGELNRLGRDYWNTDALWLAGAFRMHGEHDQAAAWYARVAGDGDDPQTRWGPLLERGRALREGGDLDGARDAFAESFALLQQVPNVPVDLWFLGMQAEMVRGIHRYEVTREYLDAMQILIDGFHDCGDCTLLHEYNVAFDYVVQLPDADDADVLFGCQLMADVIDRMERAADAGDTSNLDVLRSAYMVTIGGFIRDLRIYDQRMLGLLSDFNARYGDEETGAKYVVGRIREVREHVAPRDWAAYPELDRLRLASEPVEQPDPVTERQSDSSTRVVIEEPVTAAVEPTVRQNERAVESVRPSRAAVEDGHTRAADRPLIECSAPGSEDELAAQDASTRQVEQVGEVSGERITANAVYEEAESSKDLRDSGVGRGGIALAIGGAMAIGVIIFALRRRAN